MLSEKKLFKIENNILKSTRNLPPELKYTSLAEGILDKLNKNPDFVGQIDCLTGEEYKCEKIRDRSVRCALWMKAQGLLPEDIVLISTRNHMDAAMPCFAALFLGAIYNPLDIESHINDFRHMMNITKPKIAFVDEYKAETVAKAAEDIKLDLKIVVFGLCRGFLNFENIIANAEFDEVKNFKFTPIKNSDQTAVIVTTSGTTGAPKGVALGHSVFLKQFAAVCHSWMKPDALIFSPVSWFTGTFYIFFTVLTNTTRFVPPSFEEYTACELIERYKISFSYMPANMINRLLKSNAITKYDISSLEEITCSGTPLSIESQLAFEKLVPNARLNMAYGMTELGGPISYQLPGAKLGSSGQISEMVQMKVIERTTGKILGPNQRGELLMKSITMMNGYYNDPKATAETIDEEGWLHSGDIGYYDEDGEVYVVDRFKELIKYRDYHISPVEIENILVSHSGVKEVVVVGIPHPVDDEHPVALIVKTESSSFKDQVTEKDLIDFVDAQVADSKRLRGGIQFVGYLPKTSFNKFKRRDIRELAKSLAATSSRK